MLPCRANLSFCSNFLHLASPASLIASQLPYQEIYLMAISWTRLARIFLSILEREAHFR